MLSADQGTADKPGHTVSLIGTAAMTVRGAVGTGSGPHGVVIDTSGTRAWVTNSYDNTVYVSTSGSLPVVAAVAAGTGPSGISYSPHPPAASTTTATRNVPAPSPNTEDHTRATTI